MEKDLDHLGIYNLTPVQKHENIWFKRDDLFLPFRNENVFINGGKARQALVLILKNYQSIVNDHKKGIMTATSVNSPQGVIISYIAKKYGLKCIVGVGNTTKEIIAKKHELLKKSIEYGADIHILAKIGYDHVLAKKLIKLNTGFFLVKFGINYKKHANAIFWSNANQVQNIPDKLDYLVIPVGSALSMAGILRGIKKYKKSVKKIIGVQVGASRSKVLRSYLPFNFNTRYTLVNSGIDYAKKIRFEKPIPLDPIYEAKAYKWMVEHLKNKKRKTLFWVIGNQDYIINKDKITD
jgi:1-aminocyclopropane-1-carboxylate deaminase/D-cysteine desulfhydrase-like pyridoxal-dependent ACC family enzyme